MLAERKGDNHVSQLTFLSRIERENSILVYNDILDKISQTYGDLEKKLRMKNICLSNELDLHNGIVILSLLHSCKIVMA